MGHKRSYVYWISPELVKKTQSKLAVTDGSEFIFSFGHTLSKKGLSRVRGICKRIIKFKKDYVTLVNTKGFGQ